MRTPYLWLSFALVVAGCGGGGTPITGGPPDMAMASSGPPTLVAGDFRRYVGSTTDGWAVVVDGSVAFQAVKLADGTTQKLAELASGSTVFGDVVFFGHHFNAASGNETLALWHGDGPVVTLSDAAPDNQFGLSPPMSDQAGHISYYRAGAAGKSELVLDTVGHTAPRVLLSDVDLTPSGSCWPTLRFFAGRLLAAHCPAGATARTLTSFDVAGGGSVELATDIGIGFSAHKGAGVLATTSAGAVLLLAADGTSAPVTLASDGKSARFAPDGASAFVVTKAGALERIRLADKVVTTLQASGVDRLHVVSGDGRFVTFDKAEDPMTFLDDLWLADGAAASTATALDPATTSSEFGYGFTDDAAFALYVVGADADSLAGSLRARPTAGGAERTLAAGADVAVPMGGARIAFTANDTGKWPDVRSDIGFVDLASGAAPTTIATQAHTLFDVLADDKTIVYVQPGEGLHIVKTP